MKYLKLATKRWYFENESSVMEVGIFVGTDDQPTFEYHRVDAMTNYPGTFMRWDLADGETGRGAP